MDKKDKKSSESLSEKLLKAIKQNSVETVREIVSADTFVYPSDSNPSPLYVAATQTPPLYRIIALLCKHGADPLLELPLEMNQTQLSIRAATQMTQDNISETEWNKRFVLFTLQLEVGDLAAKFMNNEISDKEAKDKILELKRQESKIKHSLENSSQEDQDQDQEKKSRKKKKKKKEEKKKINIVVTGETEVSNPSSSSQREEVEGEGELSSSRRSELVSPLLSPGAPGVGTEGEGENGEGEPGGRKIRSSSRGEGEEGEPGG